ncbi:MAG TPA: DUF4254 domain-containing protein [Candidatus Limnocylindrales bacterium]|nr:DUF4254 domain-containing protein [Candidatus Limnocylindrales bacterium]
MELSASDIVALHDLAPARQSPQSSDAIAAAPADVLPSGDLRALVEAGHAANCAIWHLEDQARRRDVDDARIAAIKRAIDPWNQRRNDLMEAIDAEILAGYANVDLRSSELHSETAGMMIDRLSILALRIHNLDAVASAASADADREVELECRAKAKVLRGQRSDLAACLARLLDDFAAGRRHFKLYRQMKTYNDQRLNPALRAAAARMKAGAGGTGGNQ